MFGAVADFKEKIGVYSELQKYITYNTNNFKENNEYYNFIEDIKIYINNNSIHNHESFEEIVNLELKEFDYIDNKLRSFAHNNLSLDIDIKYKINNMEREKKITLNNNDILQVSGLSGSGKSIFLDIISGLNLEYSGYINFYNNDILLTRDNINIVYLFQNPMLFKASILENILLGNYDFLIKILKISKDYNINKEIITKYILKKVIIASRKANIYDRILKNKDGILNIIEDDCSNYSGGEKQRINISRLFLNKVDLVLLDEVTSNLDYFTEINIEKEIINHLQSSIGIVVSHSHNFMKQNITKNINI